MARKGSRQVRDGSGPAFRRERVEPTRVEGSGEVWIDNGPVEARAPKWGTRPRNVEIERVPVELSGVEGLSTGQLRSLSRHAGEAAADFEAERFDEARPILARLVDRYPAIPELRELYGLTLYRLGRWKQALQQLEALVAVDRTLDLHAVMADCHRALGDHARVEELWDELREASPMGDVVTEGRIVAAGSLADRGELRSAIRLLEKGPVRPKRVRESTLRLWYALADLYERVGELPLAREGFGRIVANEPRFGDAADRLAGLR